MDGRGLSANDDFANKSFASQKGVDMKMSTCIVVVAAMACMLAKESAAQWDWHGPQELLISSGNPTVPISEMYIAPGQSINYKPIKIDDQDTWEDEDLNYYHDDGSCAYFELTSKPASWSAWSAHEQEENAIVSFIVPSNATTGQQFTIKRLSLA
jgi:hypothetical protein